jgi:hypothetical protein
LLEKLRRLAKTERIGLLMKTANRIMDQVTDQVLYQVLDQVWRQVDQVRIQVLDPTWFQVRIQVCSQTRREAQ